MVTSDQNAGRLSGLKHYHRHVSREALAEALAAGVAAVLAGGIAARGEARLAVSGGSTPALFLEYLSRTDIDWSRVIVTLVDERFVASDNPRSNLGLLRKTLLAGRAAAARVIPLTVTGQGDVADAAKEADRAIHMIGRLDACILGMGTDGHTASFFPGGDRLAEAIDPESRRHVIALHAPGAGEPRLTLTLRTLLEAHFLALHIEGAEKLAVLEQALAPGPLQAMPVRSVLRAANDRIHVFWTA